MAGGANPYEGREQAWVKHEVLRRYLQRLAYKVGGFRTGTTLNYIDCFSGPWDAEKDDHGDSSPAIAMRELANARSALANTKPMSVRAMFVERDPAAYDRLIALCERAPVEASTFHGRFEEHVADAVKFAKTGSNPFAFAFIDPTGWTGFGLQKIAPLLRVQPGEVLINFMWGHIGRFIDDEGSSAEASFDALLGEDASAYRARWQDLHGLDREDEIVRTYCERVRAVGGFRYCVSTVIVNPTIDRTHYHLVYATRSPVGLITFRNTEREVTPLQRDARARAKQRKSEAKTRQLGLLAPVEMDTDYFETLVERYQAKARTAVEAALQVGRTVPYETLVDVALAWPMTSEQELKQWLAELASARQIEVVGLAPRERTPKLDAGHRVRRIG